MTYRVRTTSLLAAILATALVVGNARAKDEEPAPRHVDLELGGGAFVSMGSARHAPLEDGWYIVGSGAVPLIDRLDLELGLGVGQAHDTVTDNVRTFVQGSGGLRVYLLGGNPTDRARVFLSAGGAVLSNYARNGGVDGAVYVGPGVRLRAGERSGLVARLPFTITPYDVDESLVIPTISLFYQF